MGSNTAQVFLNNINNVRQCFCLRAFYFELLLFVALTAEKKLLIIASSKKYQERRFIIKSSAVISIMFHVGIWAYILHPSTAAPVISIIQRGYGKLNGE